MGMRCKVHNLIIAVFATGLLLATDSSTTSKASVSQKAVAVRHGSTDFESTVQPVLAKTCAPCHNDQLASGGLNLSLFSTPGSITGRREGWEKILQKLRTGQMPPR